MDGWSQVSGKKARALTQTAVTVVDEHIAAQSFGRVVVDAAGSVGHICQDDGSARRCGTSGHGELDQSKFSTGALSRGNQAAQRSEAKTHSASVCISTRSVMLVPNMASPSGIWRATRWIPNLRICHIVFLTSKL